MKFGAFRMDLEGPRRGPLRLSPPSRKFQMIMACSQGVDNYIYVNICKIGK
jgi:hypothetical protein